MPPRLPEERLNEIFSHLTTEHNTLASICLSSKSFRRTTSPLLYQHVVVNYIQPKRLRLLLRTLIDPPELSEHILKLPLDPWDPSGTGKTWNGQDDQAELAHLIEATTRALVLGNFKDAYYGIAFDILWGLCKIPQWNHWTYDIVLLLLLCRNVEIFHTKSASQMLAALSVVILFGNTVTSIHHWEAATSFNFRRAIYVRRKGNLYLSHLRELLWKVSGLKRITGK